MNDTQRIDVNDLLNRGFSIIPVEARGKRPACAWKEFQTRRATTDEVKRWFGPESNHNVGIVTGEISGVVVVDCDSADAVAWADAHLPRTPMATRTAKGEHRFFRHPGGEVQSRVRITTNKARAAVDVRADGGYVVGPGSIHETGTVYERLGDWPQIATLPVFDVAWLEPDSANRDSQTPPTEGDHGRGGQAAAIPRHVPDGRRNHTLFLEGARLRRLAWTESEICKSLLVLNQERCRPPLNESEIQHIASSVARYEPEQKDFPLTDTGNAEFFAGIQSGLVRYDHGRRAWFEFDDHWTRDPIEHVDHLALNAIRARQATALKIDDADRRKAALRFTTGSESRARRESLIRLARQLPDLAVSGDDWDTEDLLLGVGNGVVDLETGELRCGRPEDNITRVSPVDFDPSAKCPRWRRFIQEIFSGEQDLVDYIQRVLGYALTGQTTEQVFWILWGEGANGKSTLMECFMNHVLGQDYAWTMPFPTSGWTNAMSEYQKASLVGQRLVAASEVAHGGQLNEELIKSLTGGDTINARHPYGRPFQFAPKAKIFLRVNDKPAIRDESHGMWRRVKLVPFTRTFGVDTTLADTLASEASGILTWAVRGCLNWQRDGLGHPGVVDEATSEYQHDSDTLSRFVDECCLLGDEHKVGAQDLYRGYQSWCRESDIPPVDQFTQKAFGTRLRQRFRAKDGRTVTYWGLGLRAERGPRL